MASAAAEARGRELQHAYSTLFQGAGDSIWLTYVMNDRNVTRLDGGHAARQDMLGHFFLRRSLDGGATWGASLVVEEGPSAYSALQLLANGRLGVLYERADRISFATIPSHPDGPLGAFS